jgi:hypothetical protein
VELGHDDLGRRDAFLGMDAGRDTAAIVLDGDGAVGIERDQDPVAMAGQGLVDRVVGDLEHHVVKARTVVGVADIHSGPFADRVEPFQHLDGIGAVGVFTGGCCHAQHIAAGVPEPKEISGFGLHPAKRFGMSGIRQRRGGKVHKMGSFTPLG